MTDKVFVDTNVLVYDCDSTEPQKQKRARAWMAYLWGGRNGRLSFQVLQEFYSTVTQKLDPGLEPGLARRNVRLLFSWQPVQIDSRVIDSAWEFQDRFHLSWWDSLIVSAAAVSGCRYLLTEDFKEGQEFGEIKVINPFRISPDSLK